MYTNSLGDWMLGGREAGKRAMEMSSDSLDIVEEVKMRLSNPIFPNSWTLHTNSNIIIKKQCYNSTPLCVIVISKCNYNNNITNQVLLQFWCGFCQQLANITNTH